MGLESTMICVDNSDFMRNGDFVPNRLQAQQDAVNLICHTKTRSNPENNVGLMTLTGGDVLMTLTTDVGRILSKLHQVQPKGDLNLISGIRIAHLALKHRMGRNHKMRIVAFVGSPIGEDDKDMTKLAKKLKKEKVNVDIVDFGEENANGDKLTNFISTINGKEGTSSHLVTVSSGPTLSDALVSSPIVVGEDGTGAVPAMGGGGFEFGVDPNEDPELALALRVSMEEQRARQESEARKVAAESAREGSALPPTEETNEEQLLEQAMAMSVTPSGGGGGSSQDVDYSALTEEQQLALAMQMSLAPQDDESPAPMETEETADDKADEDYSEVLTDPAFLESVLSNLPGVDPQSDAIRNAMGSLARKEDDKDGKKEDKK